MKKKFIILIIILAFVSIGIFYAEDIEYYLEDRAMRKLRDFPEDYVVVKSPTGIIVENKKDQLKIEIPKDWKVVKDRDIGGTGWGRNTVLYTPDYCIWPQHGCAMEIEIYRLTGFGIAPGIGPLGFSADDIRGRIEDYNNKQDLGEKDNSNEDRYEDVIYVNQHESFREVYREGRGIMIEIPVRDKVYLFSARLFSEKCSKEFEEMLDRIEIE